MRAALALVLAAIAAPLPQDHGGKVDWVRDPEFGLAKAAYESRASMLFFTADW